MRQFFNLMISFYIKTKVQSEIVGDSEFVAIGVIDAVSISKFINPGRVGDRSAGAVNQIERTAISPCNFVIGYDTQVVGLVIVSGKIIATVNSFLWKWSIEL